MICKVTGFAKVCAQVWVLCNAADCAWEPELDGTAQTSCGGQVKK